MVLSFVSCSKNEDKSDLEQKENKENENEKTENNEDSEIKHKDELKKIEVDGGELSGILTTH